LRLEAENVVLRHQLMILRRRLHGRVRLTNHDRWFFSQLYRWFPSILKVHNHAARDACPLAQGRLSPLLASEIERAGRAPANRDRIARAGPADDRTSRRAIVLAVSPATASYRASGLVVCWACSVAWR
jgi:hypothetical protein